MKNYSRLVVFLFATWLHSASAALVDSNPGDALILDPVPVDGVFDFDNIFIGESVFVSFDRSVWGDRTVSLNAVGSITIHGTLDAGQGPISLNTNEAIFLGGSIGGTVISLSALDTLTIGSGSSLSLFGPNGNDGSAVGQAGVISVGGDVTINAAGGTSSELTVSGGDSVTLTSGGTVSYSGPERWLVTGISDPQPISIRFDESVITLQPITQAVPLPPAAIVFGSAILALLGLRRTRSTDLASA